MAYNCPACNTRRLEMTESHPSWQTLAPGIIRRRFRCSNCNHKETRYEVPPVALERIEQLRQAAGAAVVLLKTLNDALADLRLTEPGPVSTARMLNCQADCTLWSRGGCQLDIPEAGGSFAAECPAFCDRNQQRGDAPP